MIGNAAFEVSASSAEPVAAAEARLAVIEADIAVGEK
jgi:hypothetical protein